MAVPLMQKKSFIRSGEGSVASYSWTDIASGTGMIELYAYSDYETVGGAVYRLGQNALYAAGDPTLDGNTAGNYGSYSFNTTTGTFKLSAFNKPTILRGTGYINGGITLWKNSSSAGDVTAVIAFTLQKLSGGVTTDIASGTSYTYTFGTNNATNYYVYCIPFSVAQTEFKKGDILQLYFATTVGGPGARGTFHHNPVGAETNSIPTQLKLGIPINIDL